MPTAEHAPVTTPRFTPTQVRILRVLADGLNHHPDELWACIDDELAESRHLLNKHLCLLRAKLKEIGQDVVPIMNHKRVYWRRVRLYYGDDDD